MKIMTLYCIEYLLIKLASIYPVDSVYKEWVKNNVEGKKCCLRVTGLGTDMNDNKLNFAQAIVWNKKVICMSIVYGVMYI